MNKTNRKRKINVTGLLSAIGLSTMIALSLFDLANLVNADPIYWDNKTLFLAQLTTIIMFVCVNALTKISLYKEDK